MNDTQTRTADKQPHYTFSYYLGVLSIVLTLLWIGIYKFTPTEADIIVPLVENHFLTSWMYQVFSVQTVSNIIGITEIIVAAGLMIGFKKPQVAFWSGIASSIIFVVTLSFLATTPGLWKVIDGVITTNFFIVKDLTLLAVALMVVEKNKPFIKNR